MMLAHAIPILRTGIYEVSDKLVDCMNSLNTAFDGALLEALIVGVSCVFFLALSQRKRPTSTETRCSPSDDKIQCRSSKPPDTRRDSNVDSNRLRAKQAAPKTRDNLAHGGATRTSQEAHDVQKFVASIARSGRNQKQATECLEGYKAMVWQQRVDLAQHIVDFQCARSLYLSLTQCVLQAGAQAAPLGIAGWTQRLLSDMRRFGFPRTLEFYSTMLKMLGSESHWREALQLRPEMAGDGVEPDCGVLISLMSAAVACDDGAQALRHFRDLARLGPPSLRTYMTVLRVYGRRKDWRGAVQLVDEMKGLGSPPDSLVLNQVLGLCVSAGQVAAAEQLLHEWDEIVDAISCNTVLKGYTQAADLTKSEAMLQRMLSKGPAPNLITFNTIMDCAFRALQSLETPGRGAGADRQDAAKRSGLDPGGRRSLRAVANRPWELLDQLIEFGLEPDRYTCSTIVKGMHLSCGSAAEIDRAVALLRRLGPEALQTAGTGSISSREGNSRLVEVLFNTLLDICTSNLDLDRMVLIFGMMQEFNVTVSAVTFGTLIKAFGQAGRTNRCHEVWQQMCDSKIAPTVVTFGCYIDACIRNKDLATAERIFRSMADHRVRPNAVVYTSLIRGLASARQPVQAFALYREMRASGVEPTSVTFNSVLDMVARQLADPETLQEVINDMSSVNASPDVTAYSILIKASCSCGNLDNAIALFRQLRGQGVNFDQAAFNMLLLTCARADRVSDVEEIFRDMCQQDVPTTTVATAVLIKMYGRAKLPNKAFDVFDAIERGTGEKPNLYAYTCLIQACAQNRQVQRSWEVFNKMLKQRIEPDAVTYGTVIHGCIQLGELGRALSLVRHASMRAPSGEAFLAGAGEPPFALEALRLKRPVSLQPEVMHTLLAAMQRKEQSALAQELSAIMNEQGVH